MKIDVNDEARTADAAESSTVFVTPNVVCDFFRAQRALEELKRQSHVHSDFVSLVTDMLYPYYNRPSRGALRHDYAQLKNSVERCLVVGTSVDAGYLFVYKDKNGVLEFKIDMDSLQQLADEKLTNPEYNVGKKTIADKFYENDSSTLAHRKEQELEYNEAKRKRDRILSAKDLLLECDASADTSVFDSELQKLSALLLEFRKKANGKYRAHVIFEHEPITIIADGNVRGEVLRFRYRFPGGAGATQQFDNP